MPKRGCRNVQSSSRWCQETELWNPCTLVDGGDNAIYSYWNRLQPCDFSRELLDFFTYPSIKHDFLQNCTYWKQGKGGTPPWSKGTLSWKICSSDTPFQYFKTYAKICILCRNNADSGSPNCHLIRYIFSFLDNDGAELECLTNWRFLPEFLPKICFCDDLSATKFNADSNIFL